MKYTISLSILLFVAFLSAAPPDEGMFPLSEIQKLHLNQRGLKIHPADIYNPQGVSLVDALVRLSGCTGSFVSGEGLILTNHHCSFDFVRQASTVENNYLENGFLAKTHAEEIPAVGQTCLITESYSDVSAEILAAASGAASPQERVAAIRDKMKEIVKAAEKESPGIKAEVSEMFAGKSYILFKYRELKDVRLVYVPPRAVGEFGGEADNWVWPRHTGDFSFLRAYVGKDGKPAAYSAENIPYSPKKFLKMNPAGVDEGDFVFILGYPGRTFRNQPAKYIEYQERFQLPYISRLYAKLIKLYEAFGTDNPALALKFSSRIKSLANVEKNYRGKLAGMKKLDLTASKMKEEAELQEFILKNEARAKEYGDAIPLINEVYAEQFALGRLLLALSQIRNQVMPVRVANLFFEYRRSAAGEKGRATAEIMTDIREYLPEVELAADKEVFSAIAGEAAAFPELADFAPLQSLRTSSGAPFRDIFTGSAVYDSAAFYRLLAAKDEAEIERDPLLQFGLTFRQAFAEVDKKYNGINGKLNVLAPRLITAKSEWRRQQFIPDANSTLRLTFGYIRGYTPSDATWCRPFTTINGILEKSMLGDDYLLPEYLLKIYRERALTKYASTKLKDIPVAILYNMDTTGGNSGSPVMNADGELIGLNYDRTFEATINDYRWDENYSRSIGVDVRYILWVTEYIGGASNVISELNP